MTRIVNTSTNGVFSATIITSIIDEVNKINSWLNEIGYERADEGTLRIFRQKKGVSAADAKKDVIGADDFKVYSAYKYVTLKKDKLAHGECSIPLPQGLTIKSVVASVESGDVPVFATLKSQNDKDMIFLITSTSKPTANSDAYLHVIGVASEKTLDY
jgi:hypothetical protein